MTHDAGFSGIAAARRLADGCRAMDALLQQLSTDGSVAETVHAARKLGKSLRGGCTAFGLEKSAGREIQALGRLLAAPRDAVSRRKSWDRLGWNDGSAAAAAIVALLDQQMAAITVPPPPAAITWGRERIAAAEAALAVLDPDALDPRATVGFEKLERAVIKRCKRMQRHGKNDFHNTRKALKAYIGAVAFVHGKSASSKPHAELADMLGDENDLATLRGWLIAHGFTPQLVPGLITKLDQRRDQIRAHAICFARRLTGDD